MSKIFCDCLFKGNVCTHVFVTCVTYLSDFYIFMTWVFKMSGRIRICVEINETLQKGIENAIKTNYPKLKTVSDVVRIALKQFLEGCNVEN